MHYVSSIRNGIAEMSDEEQPIELWNIDGKLQPVSMGLRVMDRLRLAECAAQQLAAELRTQSESLIKQAIDRYERLHKLDRKVTLKQICAELGVNYGSARVLKSRYAKQKRKRKKS